MTHVVQAAAAAAGALLLLSAALTAYWLRTARRHSTPDYGLHTLTRGMR